MSSSSRSNKTTEDEQDAYATAGEMQTVHRYWRLAVVGGVVLAAGIFVYLLTRSQPGPKVFRLRPAYPRWSAEEPGWYRWFAALSVPPAAAPPTPSRALCRCPSRAASRADSGGLASDSSSSVSPDGAELLVKDSRGTEYRGELGDSQSSEVRPPVWVSCRAGRGLVS